MLVILVELAGAALLVAGAALHDTALALVVAGLYLLYVARSGR